MLALNFIKATLDYRKKYTVLIHHVKLIIFDNIMSKIKKKCNISAHFDNSREI